MIGESKPRPVLTPEGHARRELLAKIRDLEAMGFTRAEALDRVLGVSDTDADADAEADTAPPSGLDPDEVAAVALGRKRPDPLPAVADVIESLRRRGRW